MTPQEFDRQIRRLSDTYGAQHFKQERLTILWRKVNSYSAAWLERTVDGLIAHHRQAPMISDFEESISVERERNWKNRKESPLSEWNRNPTCLMCKDTGVYLCSHPAKGGLWGFRCHCPKGESDPRTGIPPYKQSHKDEGFVWQDMPVYRGIA